tara:strand:+ start:1157 stop:2299 length:1143 start_codon:yes stop_codon:yes gene_type:complete
MSLLSDSALLLLIGDIYEASYRPEHWNRVFAQLCQLLNARSGALLLEDKQKNARTFIASYNLPGFPEVAYRMGLAKRDLVFKIQASQPVGNAKLVARHDEVRQTNPWYYRVFMKPNDMGYIAAINFFNDDEWHVGIGLHRSFQAEPFNDDELQLLNTLTPHFQRALRIHRELYRAQSREQSLSAALSRLMLGIIVLDSHDKVIYHNPVAATLMTTHPALRVIGDRLHVHDSEDAQVLAQMLASLRDANTTGNQRDLALSLHHPDRRHPLTVLGATARETPAHFGEFATKGQVALYLSDPDSRFSAPQTSLMDLFGVTRSEAEVAIALANGLSIDDIVERKGVGKETVRSHLKGVFAKLGVSRQQDVVRVVLGSGLGKSSM